MDGLSRACGLLLVAGVSLSAACTSIVGTFELAGTGGGASSAAGSGGGAQSSSSGSGGSCELRPLDELCAGKTCSESVLDCDKMRRCGSCVAWTYIAKSEFPTSVISKGVVVDANGTATLTGLCAGKSDFGDGKQVDCTVSNAVFLARIGGGDGKLQEKRTWTGTGVPDATALALRKTDGHVLFTGVIAGDASQGLIGSIDFGQGALTGNTSTNIFVVDFDPLTKDVVKSVGAVDTSNNVGLAISSDSGGNTVVAGWFLGSFAFKGCSALASPDGSIAGFVAKLNADLSCIWLKSANSATDADVALITVDKADNIIVAGNVGAATTDLLGCAVEAPNVGPFVAKLNTNGQCLWAKTFAAQNALVRRVAVDQEQNIVIVGGFDGKLDLGAGKSITSVANIPSVAYGTAFDAFVAKLDTDGNPLAVRGFGDELYQDVTGVTIDANNDVIVVGPFFGSINLGGKTFSNPNPDPRQVMGANYTSGGFVAKLDASLSHVWSVAFTDTAAWVEPASVALGPGDEIFTTGRFYGMFDFGDGVTQNAFYSSFVVKLRP
jgi:hypothetical protein